MLLALPFMVQAETKQRTWINGRPVTIVTEVTMQVPADCHLGFDQQLDQQGWHDHIYRSVEGDKAVVIVSQRDAFGYVSREVKVTLWKAVMKKGRTQTEMWVFALKPSEVNSFLDFELRDIAEQFAGTPVRAA